MNAFLDAAVQLIQVVLLLALIAVTLNIRARLKALEEKLGSKDSQ